MFAIPTLALFWLGVDFGVGDIDTQDLVVKVVLFVLFSQLFEGYIWIFSKVTKKSQTAGPVHFFYYVGSRFPYGCDLMGFKSKITPCLDVVRLDGQRCLGYVEKRIK